MAYLGLWKNLWSAWQLFPGGLWVDFLPRVCSSYRLEYVISWHLYLHLSLNLLFTASVSLGYCEAPSEVTVRSLTGYCLLHRTHQFGCRTATAEATFCSYELKKYKQGILKWWNNNKKRKTRYRENNPLSGGSCKDLIMERVLSITY